MKPHRIALLACLMATSVAASAADVGEVIKPVCGDESTKVIVTVPADKAEAVSKVLERLEAVHSGDCIQRGPIADAWILEGTPKAMLTGIVPVGLERAPYLQVWAPRFQLLGPLKVEVVKAETAASNNTN